MNPEGSVTLNYRYGVAGKPPRASRSTRRSRPGFYQSAGLQLVTLRQTAIGSSIPRCWYRRLAQIHRHNPQAG